MKQLCVSYLEGVGHFPADAFMQLYRTNRHMIAHLPWPSYPYKPEVSFIIAYDDDNIFLKYFVSEKTIRAKVENINGNVWEDSCVEFFIGFDDQGYYNFEFNCLGVALVGFGKDRSKRELIAADVIRKINTVSTIQKTSSGLIHWELSINIPLQTFVHHSFTSLQGRQCRANFYKCGDLLPEPHFLSWSDIQSPEPNFHLSQFFGSLNFEH